MWGYSGVFALTFCAVSLNVVVADRYQWTNNQQYHCRSGTCDGQSCSGEYYEEIPDGRGCCLFFIGGCSRCCKPVECRAHSDCSATEYCDTLDDCFACNGCAQYNDPIDGRCPEKCSITSSPTASPCALTGVSGAWEAIREGNAAGFTLTYTSGLEITDEKSRTTAWSAEVSATVETGFEIFGVGGSVSTTVGGSYSREDSSLWSRTTSFSEEHTVDYDRPGTIFQWVYHIEDTCGIVKAASTSTMITDSRAHPPCCLPGLFARQVESPHTKECHPSTDGVTYYTCLGNAPATTQPVPATTTPPALPPATTQSTPSSTTSPLDISSSTMTPKPSSPTPPPSSSSSSDNNTIILVIVGVCAGVVLILGGIIGIVCYSKKKSSNDKQSDLPMHGVVTMAPVVTGTPATKLAPQEEMGAL